MRSTHQAQPISTKRWVQSTHPISARLAACSAGRRRAIWLISAHRTKGRPAMDAQPFAEERATFGRRAPRYATSSKPKVDRGLACHHSHDRFQRDKGGLERARDQPSARRGGLCRAHPTTVHPNAGPWVWAPAVGADLETVEFADVGFEPEADPNAGFTTTQFFPAD